MDSMKVFIIILLRFKVYVVRLNIFLILLLGLRSWWYIMGLKDKISESDNW